MTNPTPPADAAPTPAPVRVPAGRIRGAGRSLLTEAERRQSAAWQRQAAAELLAIRDGLLGRGWRVRARAAYLEGFLRGTAQRLWADEAGRN